MEALAAEATEALLAQVATLKRERDELAAQLRSGSDKLAAAQVGRGKKLRQHASSRPPFCLRGQPPASGAPVGGPAGMPWHVEQLGGSAC